MKKILVLLIISFNSFSHDATECDENGMADIYPCKKIDLSHRVHFENMGGLSSSSGSDIWGWTDPETDKEYALMTMNFGTAFVDVTDPTQPIYLGKLNSATSSSLWRDVKTYNNYAYIVSEANNHGMQIFDLTKLRDVSNPPVIFTSDERYTGFGSAHNIVINEETGFAYAVGSNTCNAGLHMINIQDPSNPINTGCFSSDGYTHDAQCVSYIGPDNDYNGKEICFNSNEDSITIVDVTNKSNPIQVSRTGYANSQYTHQGWLTEDQRYFLMNDELDEQRLGHKTKTYIWDMLNLSSPKLLGFYVGNQNSIDHNIYIKGNFAYLTNYTSGLSIVDISDIGNANLQEVAYFDSYAPDNSASFNGSWSNYPYFNSGTVIMSDYNSGLFVLSPNTCPETTTGQNISANAVADNSIELNWQQDLAGNESYRIFRSEGGCEVDNFIEIADNVLTNNFIDESVTGQVLVGYKVVKSDNTSQCVYESSVCVETQTTGMCTAAPVFSGLSSVNSSNSPTCSMDLEWGNASSYCQSPVRYDVFRSTNPEFIANNQNKVASNITENEWHDYTVNYNETNYYLVRARDTGNLNIENNVVKLSAKAQGELTDGTYEDTAEVASKAANNSKAIQHVGWEITSERKHSGERSYWSQANASTCSDFTTDFIKLTTGEVSELSFWTAYDIENQSDGGVVEVSTDNNLWLSPVLDPDYPNTFNNNNNACSYSPDTPSFTGTELTWKKHTVDLSNYQGQDIKVRWNYSTDDTTTNEGWFLDDIKVTHVQTAASCQTVIAKMPQAGLWYDKSRNGHGIVVEPVGFNDLYFSVFYTYKDDGTPEWYTSLTQLENGVLNINLDDNSLQRFIYDYSISPVGTGRPNIIDTTVGTNILSIDFNSEELLDSPECNDGTSRGLDIALAKWQLGSQQDTWCIEPLVPLINYPSPDFGGTWWTGIDDDGWGISLAYFNDVIITVIYYYDQAGNPRWVLGQNGGFERGVETTVDLYEHHGFGRMDTPVETTKILAGTVTFTINSYSQMLDNDGSMSIDANYQGSQGGNWKRTNVPLSIITKPH